MSEIEDVLNSLAADIQQWEERADKHYKLWSEANAKVRQLTATKDYLGSYGQNGRTGLMPETEEDGEESTARKKGLRQKGVTRDVFQVYSMADAGLTLAEAAKHCGCSEGHVRHVIFRFTKFGFFAQEGDRYILTPAGRELVKRSNPYRGSASLPGEQKVTAAPLQSENAAATEANHSEEEANAPAVE